MKKVETLLKEYVTSLTDDNLKFLDGRFSQRLGGDLADASTFLSESNEVDRWLASARCAGDFYDMLDLAAKFVEKEGKRRGQYAGA